MDISISAVSQEIIYEASSISIDMIQSINYTQSSSLPNGYFSKCNSEYDKEKQLHQVMQMDIYNSRGVPIYYYKLDYDISATDRIFGEKNDAVYKEYWGDVQGSCKLPRENRQLSNFGSFEISQFPYHISKMHFDYVTSGVIPKQGDLIQFEYNLKIYEVVEVKGTSDMFLNDKRYTWTLILDTFKDEFISIEDDVLTSPLSAYANKSSDVYDISNAVEVEKAKNEYDNLDTEYHSNDPFVNWD